MLGPGPLVHARQRPLDTLEFGERLVHFVAAKLRVLLLVRRVCGMLTVLGAISVGRIRSHHPQEPVLALEVDGDRSFSIGLQVVGATDCVAVHRVRDHQPRPHVRLLGRESRSRVQSPSKTTSVNVTSLLVAEVVFQA